MRFDLVDLRLFLYVCEAGSMTGGAARAHLTLQSASERIRGMEDELGVPLLHRVRTGVHPTDAGRSLSQHAVVVLRQIEHMRSDLRQYGKGLRGRIRLFCNTSALNEHLPEILADYLVSYPDISTSVEEKRSKDIVAALRNQSVDIGIVADTVDLYGLEQIPFREDKLVVVVPAGSPLASGTSVAFQDIVEHPFIGLVEASALQAHISAHAQRLRKPLVYRANVGTFDALYRMVACGVGIAIVPGRAAMRLPDPSRVCTVELADQWAHRTLMVCVRSIETLPEHVREFITFITTKRVESAKSGEEVTRSLPSPVC